MRKFFNTDGPNEPTGPGNAAPATQQDTSVDTPDAPTAQGLTSEEETKVPADNEA